MKVVKLSRSHAELLLAGVIVARATSYLFSKLILEGMGMFNLLGMRFCLAFAVLAVLFFPRLKSANRKTVIAGAVMGGMYFLVVSDVPVKVSVAVLSPQSILTVPFTPKVR